ncbi:hypothetical protein BC835DRAFT_497567 [Cytidiella melzeri]|nr:hypothetical protein BC835DRAFT_497567 [Cytidiella melzeri]
MVGRERELMVRWWTYKDTHPSSARSAKIQCTLESYSHPRAYFQFVPSQFELRHTPCTSTCPNSQEGFIHYRDFCLAAFRDKCHQQAGLDVSIHTADIVFPLLTNSDLQARLNQLTTTYRQCQWSLPDFIQYALAYRFETDAGEEVNRSVVAVGLPGPHDDDSWCFDSETL